MSALLSVKNMNVSYGAIKALRDVSIDVAENKIVAILGANGAGKSTLLKKISGLIGAESGSVVYAGRDITKLSAERITKEGIVHTPEGRKIFDDLTVRENLQIGAFTVKKTTVSAANIYEEAMSDRVKALIKEKGHKDFNVTLSKQEVIKNNYARVYSVFPVLKERKDQIAKTLSGGEQQMLAIGRSLMGTPRLLILDEPSLGLAPLIVRNIFNIIEKLNEENITVLIVEQNALQTLKIADYAYVLRVGKIIKEGSAKELIEDESLVEAYLGA